MANVAARQILVKQPSEILLYTLDFTPLLEASETLTAIVTTPAGSPSGLTFQNAAINTGTITLADGRVIAIGKALQVTISAGTSAQRYRVSATARTSLANPANPTLYNERTVDGDLDVQD